VPTNQPSTNQQATKRFTTGALPTRPTTHTQVLGCVKNAVVILTAVALFSEEVNWTQGVGYAISSAAFLVSCVC
jgi:hypothetical protein